MVEAYRKQGYLLEDFRLFHLKGAVGVKNEYHYHEFCKLLLLVSGNGGYWVEGQRYALQAGDIVLLGSGCVHRPEFSPDGPYQRYIFYISPAFLRRISTQKCDLSQLFNGQWGHVYRPERTAANRLHTLTQRLEAELAAGEYGCELVSESLLVRLLVELSRHLRTGDALVPAPAIPDQGRIGALIRYIEDHLTEELSVDSLAAEFFISKFHLMRQFRSSTGLCLNAYIIQRRLLLAKELMAAGISATESCFRAGFGSYSAFTRSYGKYFGTTPTGRQRGTAAEEIFE